MQPLKASIPHRLTRAEVKKRIQDGLADIRGDYGAWLHHFRESWTGDRMDFTAGAMGLSIPGHLDVDDQAVHVEVVLPWFLNMVTGSVKQQIEHQGEKLLGGNVVGSGAG
jgi:hypothetical protein